MTTMVEPPQTFWITPRLFIGKVPAGLQNLRRVSSPEEALRAINDGFTAVLPPGAWVAAQRILLDLGLSQRDALDRIKFARDGVIGR
jgi:hypothetical protein